MELVSRNIGEVEIWGGAEYTIVRINDNVCDQLSLSGHEERPDDLNLFADLNIGTIRYPLLWERYAQDQKKFFDVNDKRLSRLQELDIKPIAGLLHHGSGPFFTDLYDARFPELLAGFALTVAQRYPWIDLYTPVNEPLTTARFSGLYGVWYPHKTDDYSFLRMLLNELKGVILSMKAIRTINKDAKLIQTEDICKIHSTNKLKYQADFENNRRWLTYDILLGKVDSFHPLYNYFINSGILPSELDFFIENTLTPEICGYNYYVTSERYLDQRKSIYPSSYHGGNGKHSYADVEVVRANIPIHLDQSILLKEAWERYHLPLALTEVHLACTREEQIRWFNDAYKAGVALRKEGVDFRAITAWSFFGSFDWNTLLRKKNNYYESGVFDIRSGIPRATALAGLIASINSDVNDFTGDLLKIPGWWKRKDRFIYKDEFENINLENSNTDISDIAPLLIVGATGSLGRAFAKICDSRGIVYYLSDRRELDIASEESVRNFLNKKKPWGVINAAGFARIDEAETASSMCFRENTIGPALLANACKHLGIKFVTFSTDQVFNGKKRKPYKENDSTQPLNLYGYSKILAEEKVLKANQDSLIIRSSFFFNPWHQEDFLGQIISSANMGGIHYYLPSDIIISPTYVPDLVNNVLDLLIDRESGIWHLSNQEEISYYDFARSALTMAGLSEKVISSVPASRLKYPAVRPSYSVLMSSAGITLPLLSDALQSFMSEFLKEPILQLVNQST